MELYFVETKVWVLKDQDFISIFQFFECLLSSHFYLLIYLIVLNDENR